MGGRGKGKGAEGGVNSRGLLSPCVALNPCTTIVGLYMTQKNASSDNYPVLIPHLVLQRTLQALLKRETSHVCTRASRSYSCPACPAVPQAKNQNKQRSSLRPKAQTRQWKSLRPTSTAANGQRAPKLETPRPGRQRKQPKTLKP